jgi:hypothetical protein
MWVENVHVPQYALTDDMYPKLNDSNNDYGRTTVYSACVPAPKDTDELKKLNVGSSPAPRFHKNCKLKEVLLEVI